MSRPLGLKRSKLTPKQEREAYEAVTARDLGQCQRCGFRGPTDRDHRQNRDRFNTVPSNLHLLGSSKAVGGCGCHQWATEHPAEAIRDGFAVPRWANPAEWPAYRIWDGWVLYYDEPNERGEWWRSISEAEARELMT